MGTTRLAAIDAIRGICIMSMVSAHIAAGTLFARAMHVMPAFDGASGFVLLSGLVLGIVQRKRFARDGLAAVQRKTVSRLWVILLAQVFLVVLAIVIGAIARYEHRNVPPLDELEAAEVILGAFTLHLAPPSGSVLRLYLALMAIGMLAYLCLAKGRWRTVLICSSVVYGLGWLIPDVTSFRSYNSNELGANWACWQLLFILALTIGWYWRQFDLAARIHRRLGLIMSLTGALIVLSFIGERALPALYDKTMLGPALLLNAYAVVLFLFSTITWILRIVPRWLLRPVEIVGTRSLDSYIIQAGVAILVPSLVRFPSNSALAFGVAVLTLILCWAWAEYRRSRWWRRTLRPRATGTSIFGTLENK